MIFAIELEKCVAGVGILDIVVGKFYYRKKPCLVILFKIDKDLKVGFHCTILPFDLTVRLWMEGGGKFLLDIEKKI